MKLQSRISHVLLLSSFFSFLILSLSLTSVRVECNAELLGMLLRAIRASPDNRWLGLGSGVMAPLSQMFSLCCTVQKKRG